MNNNPSLKPDAFMLSTRIASARKEMNLSQQDFAKRLGLRHAQTVSAIESGQRAVSAQELLKIMQLTGKSLEFFTDPYILAGEGQFSFRVKDVEDSDLTLFQQKAGRWMAAYRHIGQLQGERPAPLSYRLNLNVSNTFEDARAMAETLVDTWELGDIPAARLNHFITSSIGIPVLYVDPEKDISGAACRIVDLNVILIRRSDAPGRRNYDLAHELFHILTWDVMLPSWHDRELWQQTKKSKEQRIEKLANNFASALLMPEKSLRNFWCQRGNEDFNRWLVRVALHYQVSVQALKWRLINLEWCNMDEFKDVNLSNLVDEVSMPPPKFSEEFAKRLHWAIEKGVLSARKAAAIVDCMLDELLELFRSYDLSAPFDL